MNEHPAVPDDTERMLRILEAVLFASADPLSSSHLQTFLDEDQDCESLLIELQRRYASRGINLVRREDTWAFRTADDLASVLRREEHDTRKMPRVALETLAIIAYHQPCTRAEIEDIRGVATGKGTIDLLLEAEFIRMRGRRRTPGRPVTYGTTTAFLDHFGLETLADLPGLDELKGAGLLAGAVEGSVQVPPPYASALAADEDPLAADDDGNADDEVET